jgi:mRNA-degrading endonuclease RelE of RelBE toxin-antitoxin system
VGAPYPFVFAPEVAKHLHAIDRKHHAFIKKEIRLQLRFEPNKPTRNRKPLDIPAPYGAQWELRLGPRNRFRVFYEVVQDPRAVKIVAIGVKDREVLRIGSEEFRQ